MDTREIINHKNIVLTARIVSMVFTPFYLPLFGLAALLFLSYLNRLPLNYKLITLAIVYILTIFLPTVLINFYRHFQGWTSMEGAHRERRMIPYIISIACYFACYYIMALFGMPSFMGRIVLAALLLQIICALINVWWKISTHSAAIGGFLGAIMAFALLFQFDPLGWLSFGFLIAGLVGSARIILMQHSLSQVIVGFSIGMVIAFAVII